LPGAGGWSVTALTRRDRAVRWVRYFRCRACARYYPRRLRSCPECRTRKYEYGYGLGKVHLPM
jgi:hypothetical protein